MEYDVEHNQIVNYYQHHADGFSEIESTLLKAVSCNKDAVDINIAYLFDLGVKLLNIINWDFLRVIFAFINNNPMPICTLIGCTLPDLKEKLYATFGEGSVNFGQFILC